MAVASVPYVNQHLSHSAQLFRQAIGTLLNPAGGTVKNEGLKVTEHSAANMTVNVEGGVPGGQIWVPGTSSANVQSNYYGYVESTTNLGISAASSEHPRIDTIVAQIIDETYAGIENKFTLSVIPGTPTAGATLTNLSGKGAVPASSLVLAYVLVGTSVSKIENAEIKNVVGRVSLSQAPPIESVNEAQLAPNLRLQKSIIATEQTRENTAYGLMPTHDEVTVTLLEDGLVIIAFQAMWKESVSSSANAQIFIGTQPLKMAFTGGENPIEAAAAEHGGTANLFAPISTTVNGLVGTGTTLGYVSDVTTGQLVGVTGAEKYGVIFAFAAAGTYAISVQWKATTGHTVTAKNRKLWAKVL